MSDGEPWRVDTDDEELRTRLAEQGMTPETLNQLLSNPDYTALAASEAEVGATGGADVDAVPRDGRREDESPDGG